MKTNVFSLLVIACLLFFAGCASDDVTNKSTHTQEPDAKELTAFVVEDNDTKTRTTAEYDGSGLNFYWTAGDRLWVNTGTAASPVLTQDVENSISNLLVDNPTIPTGVKRAAKASFSFEGTYTASSYPVRYTGRGNINGDKVTIKASQTQNIPNDASHIREDGDFGVATAAKPTGSSKYYFTLDHKAAYITFMPHTTDSYISNATIQKIRVFTGNPSDALAGTFNLADDGTLSNPTNTSNSVTLTVPNFYIPSTETYATNGATMIVNPGTYSNVSIEYTLYDPVTYITGTLTKTYPSVTFTAGRNKKVNTDLQVTVYPHNAYYMWDAQQQYWYNHESYQPLTNGITDWTNNWPQSEAADPDRWYSDVRGYNDPTGTAPAAIPITPHFQALPNLNELFWYIQKGEPHWDTELWATMGRLYAGGMWFKKKSKISGYRTDKAPDGIDHTRITSEDSYNSGNGITLGKPDNLNDYFYLPALGDYVSGRLYDVGRYGYYWQSTPGPLGWHNAYYMMFYSNSIAVTNYKREFGFRLFSEQ